MARFLIGYNDNRSWEERTAEDCHRVGLDPLVPHIDIVETARLLCSRNLMSAREFAFFINSDRPITRLIERCQSNRLQFVRVAS